MHVGIGVISIAPASDRRGDEADLLIVADHALRDAAAVRRCPDAHSFTPFSRSAFRTTVKDDSAIAAPASIGDSRMPATG